MKSTETWIHDFDAAREEEVAWFDSVLQRFTEPCNLVVSLLEGPLFATEVCLLLEKQKRLVGRNVGPSCLTEIAPQLILTVS